ncbi:SDR family NAD(P)-dependent oxidoreductase [Phenylobacterium sp.]|uniref:SDR family NAD(P)-dependent oxidoreductase n=1 Tax=Phenylobacterium sp. TaxID=1871053 RepID=UPI003D2D83D0
MASDTPLGVVVGAGGIGRALAQAMAADPAYDRVLVIARRPVETPGAELILADLLDDDAMDRAAQAIADAGRPSRVIVATGVLHGPGLSPEKTMRALTAEALTEVLRVNAVGPALVARRLLPLMPRDRPSAFAAISARVGSIGDNHLGGWYGYRASKAALNMLIRTLAVEHRRTHPLGLCVALHPGTVDTALSAPFQRGVAPERLFTPEVSAAALMQVLDGLGPDASGGFYAWDGAEIPW